MRKTARVCIISDGKILLIHRFYNGKEYLVVPGGGINNNETPSTAAIREIYEELSISIEAPVFLSIHGKHTFFTATTYTGTITIGGEEKERMRHDNTNIYIPEWHTLPLSFPLYPKGSEEIIADAITHKIRQEDHQGL